MSVTSPTGSPTHRSGPSRVAVVGGGIAGLATAHALLRTANGRPLDVVVLEAGPRLGGKVATVEVGGITVEAGADSFVVRKPWAVELCRELGLDDQLIVPGSSGAFVWTGGRLVPFPPRSAFGVPAGLGALLRWPGLSIRARLRATMDVFKPRTKRAGDVALGPFLRRRMGVDAARVLVEPVLAGLHAGDPDRLSVDATFPELRQWERGHDSLLLGARAALKAPGSGPQGRRPMFATLWGGLDGLTSSLADAVGRDRIRTDVPVGGLHGLEGGGFEVDAAGSQVQVDAVVLATPAFEASRLLREANAPAAGALGDIPYASTAVVALVYPEGTGDRLPEGTGFVVPGGDGRTITACTWLSRKWPRESFGDRAVVRCFVGRAGQEDALHLPDDELIGRVTGEVASASPVGAEPDAATVVRWARGMPQYEVGHLERLAQIDGALEATPGLFVTGSAYRGVGLADCIRQAEVTAGRVRAWLGGSSGPVEAPPAQEAISWTT